MSLLLEGSGLGVCHPSSCPTRGNSPTFMVPLKEQLDVINVWILESNSFDCESWLWFLLALCPRANKFLLASVFSSVI